MKLDNDIQYWASLCESNDYDRAKKIGYLGPKDDEERIADWLQSDYAKWKQHTLDVFVRISGGDEDKGQELFNEFDWISSMLSFANHWSDEEKTYLPPEKFLEKFSKKVPSDDPEIKELFAKLEEKWKSQNKGVAEYYATSSSRGGWTGD